MDVYHHRELSEEERRRRGVAGGLVTARKEKMKNAGKVGVEGWRAEVGSRRRRYRRRRRARAVERAGQILEMKVQSDPSKNIS